MNRHIHVYETVILYKLCTFVFPRRHPEERHVVQHGPVKWRKVLNRRTELPLHSVIIKHSTVQYKVSANLTRFVINTYIEIAIRVKWKHSDFTIDDVATLFTKPLNILYCTKSGCNLLIKNPFQQYDYFKWSQFSCTNFVYTDGPIWQKRKTLALAYSSFLTKIATQVCFDLSNPPWVCSR